MENEQTFFVNEHDNVFVDDPDDEEFDQGENDFNYAPEERNNLGEVGPNQRGVDQGAGNQQNQALRILQGRNLQQLGEGRIYFWTTRELSNSFQILKNGLRNYNEVFLEVHNEEEYVLVFQGSTPERNTYTQKEVDSIIEETKRNTEYEVYLLLEASLSREVMIEIQTLMGIPDSTKKRIRKRS